MYIYIFNTDQRESDSLHKRKTIHLFGSDGDIKRFSPDGVVFVHSREMRLHLKQILENDTIQWKFVSVCSSF